MPAPEVVQPCENYEATQLAVAYAITGRMPPPTTIESAVVQARLVYRLILVLSGKDDPGAAAKRTL